MQCSPTPLDSPCSGSGVCGYDATNRKAKCFCNEGWGGPFCGDPAIPLSPPLKSWAGNIAGGFFGGLLVGAAGVLAYNTYTSVRGGGDWRAGLQLERLFNGAAFAASSGTPYAYKPAEASVQGGGGAAFSGSNDGAEAYRPPEGNDL